MIMMRLTVNEKLAKTVYVFCQLYRYREMVPVGETCHLALPFGVPPRATNVLVVQVKVMPGDCDEHAGVRGTDVVWSVVAFHRVFSDVVVSQRSWWRLSFFLQEVTTSAENMDRPRTKVTLGPTSHLRNGPASNVGQPCFSV